MGVDIVAPNRRGTLGAMAFRPERILADVIAAARRALADLDADQVPPSLHKVAASTGRSLPPPFARALLRELGSNELLRERAVEHLGAAAEVASSFLSRPSGWELALLRAGYEAGTHDGVRADQAVAVERDALAAELASLEERLKAAQRELVETQRTAQAEVEAARAPGRRDRAAEQRLHGEVERLEQELASARAEADASIDDLRKRLSDAQERARPRRDSGRDGSERPPTEPVRGPEDLAAALDRLADLASKQAVTAPPGRDRVSEPLRFPAAIRPDAADAVDWMLTATDADVFVDGYNLGFLLAGGRLDPPAARLKVDEVRRRLATPGLRLVVVYDSQIAPVEPDATGRGVRFSEGRSADDVLVELAAASDRAIVVSNDREVRERAASAGAVVVWSDAVVEWSRRR